MAPQGHCRRHTSGRLSSAAAMLAVALLVLGPLVHSARARKPEPERPAPGAGVVAWIPVHLGPPPDRPAPGQQQTGPVVAEHTGAAAPIPAGAGVAPQEVAPSGLPNLRYYNAPNGSYYVTPWENLHWGDAVTVYWGVCNIGAADIPNGTRFDWRFYLSTDNYISTGDYAWCNLYRTVGLQAWYYIAGDFTHTLPPSPPPGFPADGIVYIGMFIDYNEAIAESNEEDNRNQGLFKDYDYVTMGAAGEPIIRVEPASLTFTATVGLGPSSAASPAVPVASAAQDEGAIAVTLPDAGGFTVRDTPQGQVIEAPGFATSAPPGEPLLPVATLRLLVPPDIDWRSLRLSLTGGRWVDVPGTYDLAPAPPLASDGPGGPVVDWGGKDPSVIREGRDTRAYGLRAFTPASPLLIASRGGYRQWRIVTVEYRPFSYNPPEKRLRRLEGGRAELSFGRQGAGGQPGGGANVALPLQQKFWERLRPGLANADAVSLYYPQAAPSSTAPLEPGPAANDYVIITTASIQQNSARLADFVQAKEAGGHTVKIVVEGAAEDATHYLSGGSAAQRANNIRTWLANHYLAEGIDYVLLIGDPNPAAHSSTSVPMKMCYPRRGAGSYEESPTDMFYSDLTGSWDPDGDGYYGEYSEVGVVGGIDRLAEVSVGRIPFYGDYDELDGILLKLAAYGQASGDLAWRQKLLVAAAISNHGPQDNNGDGDATDSGDYPASWRTFGDTWGEALKSVAGANGFGTYSLYERQGVYSDGSAYPLTPCDAGLTRDNLVSAWQGHYGFVDWWG
ncbi:MAG: C25 family cysteine peptidase, partial [Anaerolineae bacterium]|nr:C25 family cysteine peptidase [Anaerolineae bacterium]